MTDNILNLDLAAYVVVLRRFSDGGGVYIVGPFPDDVQASAWATSELQITDWIVATDVQHLTPDDFAAEVLSRRGPFFIAIDNLSGAICCDEMNDNGTIREAPPGQRYEKVERLWPGQRGYLLFRLCEWKRYRAALDEQDPSYVYSYGHLIGSYRCADDPAAIADLPGAP